MGADDDCCLVPENFVPYSLGAPLVRAVLAGDEFVIDGGRERGAEGGKLLLCERHAGN